MTVIPSTFRTPEYSKTSSILDQLQRNLQAMAEQQRQISSGKLYETPSDAPLSVRRMISWQRWIDRNEKFSANISLAESRLSASESSLDELGDMIIRAREIALQEINGTASDETRHNASVEVSSMIDESVALANRQFGSRYLFGGTLVGDAPFERVGDYVLYRGDEQTSKVEIGASIVMQDSVTGARAFGGMSAEIQGTADIDPTVTEATRLSELNHGRGIQAGYIELRDETGTRVFVDLRQARTVGDVLKAIDDTGFATASINASGNGLTISKAGADLDIADVNGGRTASDLGIVALNGGPTIVGADLDPIVTERTLLASLRGGAGLDTQGFTINNGGLSATIDSTGLESVEDLLNAVDGAGVYVRGGLGTDGSSIAIRSVLAGSELTIDEGAGATAAQLGLSVASSALKKDALNGGVGVFETDGADFRVSLADGTDLDVDILPATTLGEIATLINDHADNGGKLVAEVVAGEDRLRLTDTTAGAETFEVTPINGSYTAANLGIEGSGTGGVLEGQDLNPGGVRLDSAFDGFALLYRGLATSDVTLLNRAIRSLDSAESRVLETRAEIGGQIRRLEISSRRTELESFEMKDLLSQEGDTDLAEAIVNFQQQETVYQASLQTAASLVQPTLLDFLG